MLQFRQDVIEDVVSKLNSYFEIDVEFGNSLFTVTAEGSKAISEFEVRLVAEQMRADGDWDEENVNGEILMNELVDLIDTRESFGPQVTRSGSWRARYSVTPY
jgi:hypothetical protein